MADKVVVDLLIDGLKGITFRACARLGAERQHFVSTKLVDDRVKFGFSFQMPSSKLLQRVVLEKALNGLRTCLRRF